MLSGDERLQSLVEVYNEVSKDAESDVFKALSYLIDEGKQKDLKIQLINDILNNKNVDVISTDKDTSITFNSSKNNFRKVVNCSKVVIINFD